MEWLTVSETAHLSVKKPHGTSTDQMQSSNTKCFGLNSNYWKWEEFNYAIHQKITGVWQWAVEHCSKQTTHTTTRTSIQYTHTNICSAFYQNINTLGLCLQTSKSLRFIEHPPSMTSHSEAFGGPPVLIKTSTSFSNKTLAQPQTSSISCWTTCLLGGFWGYTL